MPLKPLLNFAYCDPTSQIVFSFDARDFPLLEYNANLPDSDDDEKKLSKPGRSVKKKPVRVGWNPWSYRGCGNVASLTALLGGIISLLYALQIHARRVS